MESQRTRTTFASRLTREQFQNLCDNFDVLNEVLIKNYCFDSNSFFLLNKNIELFISESELLSDKSRKQFKLSLKTQGPLQKKYHFVHSPMFTEDINRLFGKGQVPPGRLNNKLTSILSDPISCITEYDVLRFQEKNDDFILKLDHVFLPKGIERFKIQVDAIPGKEKKGLLFFSNILNDFEIPLEDPMSNYKELARM